MEIHATTPPRRFKTGIRQEVELTEQAKISLTPDEQITFLTEQGGEYDVVRKSWGFYATPSLNSRLPRFNLRPVVVKNTQERWFVLLVERGRESDFTKYCHSEQLIIIGWLDEPATLATLKDVRSPLCLCGAAIWQPLFHYDAPPAGETHFPRLQQDYQRDFMQCQQCGHCRAEHTLPLEKFYEGSYVSDTYGDTLKEKYDRIMALPEADSDNAGRVARITAEVGQGAERSVLDVGSGLGVFLARMKQRGWQGVALDPDERAIIQARDVVGVRAVQADFFAVKSDLGQFDLIAFNKVLEHVSNPEQMLTHARHFIKPNGIVYIEVPDGEVAALHGREREEFFVEHWHAFSPISLLHLLRRSGLIVRSVERLQEPSGKYTLRAFGVKT